MVKIRELPDRPQSKDNWRFKHHLVWEESRGLRLPEGWTVLFCDHDIGNFDPANLKAVPRRLVGPMNSGPPWHDRASCELAAALAALRCQTVEVLAAPRPCGVCGREFEPTSPGLGGASQVTCPECLARGLRAPRGRLRRGKCEVCGAEFETRSATRRTCSEACRQRLWTRTRKKKREDCDG